MTNFDYRCLMPILIIAGSPVVIMLILSLIRSYRIVFFFSLAALITALFSVSQMMIVIPRPVGILFMFDGFGAFFITLIIVAALMILTLSHCYNRKQSEKEEFLIILFTATLGASVLAVANHFISFFIGLEILSLSLFILIAFRRIHEYSIEAAVKYLVLASVSSAFLLFGMALVYASAGTMNFSELSSHFMSGKIQLINMMGFIMMIVGIGFKLALVPFHMWTPDVYEGAPAPVTALIASVSKAAVMAVLFRFFFAIKGYHSLTFFTIISAIAILTMFVGNFLAVRENNLKRILAYSSIANLGYLLITPLTGTNEGINSAIFYLISYVFTTIGAFSIITLLSPNSHDNDKLNNYKGLFWQHPWLATVFSLMLLSLAGIPLTSGFMAKFYIALAALKSDLIALVIVLIINSVIGLYYYLRIIITLFSPVNEEKYPPIPFSGHLVLIVIVLAIVWLGLFPGGIVDSIARYAILD